MEVENHRSSQENHSKTEANQDRKRDNSEVLLICVIWFVLGILATAGGRSQSRLLRGLGSASSLVMLTGWFFLIGIRLVARGWIRSAVGRWFLLLSWVFAGAFMVELLLFHYGIMGPPIFGIILVFLPVVPCQLFGGLAIMTLKKEQRWLAVLPAIMAIVATAILAPFPS